MRRKHSTTIGISALCAIAHLSGQPSEGTANITELEPFEVISGTRLTDSPFEQPYAFYRTDVAELNQRIGRTALDRLNYSPGVFIQRTAPNQASPFIRGLTGEQALLMIDGVRLSHAFMRPGPNQYAALVPDTSISSIDAILGSTSTVNGSDGLTGGLDFRLAPAGRGVESGFSPFASTRIDSGNGITWESGIDGVSGNWAYSVEFNIVDFHDREGGKDFQDHLAPGDYDGRIPNTAYDQYGAGLRLAYLGFEDRSLELKTGYNRQNEAPRPGGYPENSKDASRIYRFFDPQEFTYLHLRDSWQVGGEWIDNLQTTLWWHNFSEEQFRSRLRSGGTVNQVQEFDDSINSFGLDLQATTYLGSDEAHELTWGGTYIYEKTDNSYREFRGPAGGTLTAHQPDEWSSNTTVSDGSTYESLGFFVQDDWRINDQFSLLSGLRYSYYEWSFGDETNSVDDLTASIRGTWRVKENHRLFAGVSRGFRAPNLVNLDGQVDRGSSGNFVTGDPNLDPETSLTYEAGWKWQRDRDFLALTVFRTEIDDFIQPDYTTAPDPITTNVEGARLQGFETAWDYGASFGSWQRIALIGSLSLVDATRDIPLAGGGTFEDNISRANRLYGSLGLRAEKDENWWGLLQVRWHDTYDDVSKGSPDDPNDNGDADDVRLTTAGNPDGSMPGYGVFDLIVGWQSDDGNVSVSVFLENIGDKTYREPGSGVDGVGRNLGLQASVRF